MKAARLLLLLLLALLLPLRSAVAASLLCPMSALPQAPAVMAEGAGHCHQDEDKAAPAKDACHLCAAFCTLTPLPSVAPTVSEALPLAALRYPALAVPAPSFLSSGPERPPRSR